MKPGKENKSVSGSEGAMVDLLNTEMQQLQDNMLINGLKELAKSNPGNIYEKLLDLLNRRQEELSRTYCLLAQSQERELDYIQRNSELLKKNTSLTNHFDNISEKYKLYKDAHEAIKKRAASLFKQNKELKSKLTLISDILKQKGCKVKESGK